MGISSPGIGSNLDVNGIVSKLMAVESQPLTTLATKEASYQAQLSGFGSLSGALSAFQTAITTLSTPTTFQSVSASVGDTSILTATANSQAISGSYSVNVTQLAQAQTIMTAGQASSTTAIGTGGATTLTFQFGSINAAGSVLGASVASGGIAAGSLSLNGTTIVTGSSTTSAKALAAQINLASTTTGVSATAAAADTGVLAFTPVSTGAGDSYTLTVGSTTLASVGAASGLTAAQLDAAIASNAAGLASDKITVSGSAAGGDLRFTRADGSNIDLTQTLVNTSGTAVGGVAGLASGVTQTYLGAVSLSPAGGVTIGGSNPAAAGFSAGPVLSGGIYSGAGFTQDPNQPSGTVTIDSTNNSLQGIRDAINKANLGVTATIVSDGSAAPNHLVLTSTKTGITSSMKIAVTGDPALSGLLAYDPAATQNMTQSNAAQNTALTVNGIAISSATQTVNEAVQGTTLTVSKLGATTLSVAPNTGAVTASVNTFVAAYNSLAKTISSLTSYDPTTKQAGLLLGDATTRQIQTQIRGALSSVVTGSSGSLTNLTQIGISFNKDGTMALDASKLQSAITNNLGDIGTLFATVGTASDSLIKVAGSTSATQVGSSTVNITTLASQGKQTGSAVAGLVIDSSNNQLGLTVDGTSTGITLLPGSYTPDSLAAQLQSAINSAAALSSAGIAVSVSHDSNGILTITSNRYGSASNVSLGGSGAANLLGATPVSTAGVDVAGTINGLAATGSGQMLTGANGSSVEGLQLQIIGGLTGARGTVNFSQGYAYQLSRLVNGYVGGTGSIASSTDGINRTIQDINNQTAEVNARLVTIEANYRAQFTALDVTIGSMSATTDFLTQQLAQISNLSKQ